MDNNKLILGLRQKDEAVFKYFVDTYQTRVFNTVVSMVQHHEEAEDIAQEVFIEVYNSINSFKGDSKISTWVYRIAVNKALEALRKKKTAKRFSFLTSLFGDKNAELVYDKPDFEHPGIVLENKERAVILFRAINKLPENQKTAFVLHNIEGLSYQEILEVMQISLSSVESLLFRAKTNLRVTLKTYYKIETS